MSETKEIKVHKLPFDTLGVGDSFKIKDKLDIPYIRNRAYQVGKRLNRKFKVNAVRMVVERTE